ncbi:MAG: hypothetical protein AAF483_29885, partial [Planctomycetota bacterium]
MSRKWLIATILLLVAVGSIAYGIWGQKQGDAVAEKGEPLDLFNQQPIGLDFTEPPQISFVELVDLNEDSLSDVLVCDCTSNTLSWIQQNEKGEF